MKLYCNFARILSVSLLLATLALSRHAVALGKPPAPDAVDKVNGLGGTVSIASAATSVLDRSYPMSAATNPLLKTSDEGQLSIGEYVAQIAKLLPGTVAGLAFQVRSYTNGPYYTSPELTIGNFPSGVDASYQHYEGGLHGDGIGLRYSPSGRDYASERRTAAEPLIKGCLTILSDAALINTALPGQDVLTKTRAQISAVIIAMTDGGSGGSLVQLLQDLLVEITKLDSLLEAAIEPIQKQYAEAYVKRTFALIVGDSNVSGTTDFSVGGSLSEVYPLAKHLNKDHPVIGGGWLLSAQQEFIRIEPQIATNVTRCGLSLVLQDRVATHLRPTDRWKALVGVEYVPQTVLDNSATYDIFARYRPYYRTNCGGYMPLELTAFAGISSTGQLFVGGRFGFGFSL